ncbi:MAG: sigma 54-interacting transcriptional regulator [Polyangiaceae bacterium]
MGAKTPVAGTTRPSAKPTGTGGLDSGAAIHWVHPRQEVSLLHDGHLFGRDEACDTVLLDDEISRRHAQVRVRGLLPILSDLDSRNGLYVNGSRQQQHPVGPGDVVRIGTWVGVVVEQALRAKDQFELLELFPGWYGGTAFRTVAEEVQRVAKTTLPVVVQGETGTGKEGLARALHSWSERSGPFVAVDCGALSEQLVEGALFGYRKGAFTGADRAHDGYFKAADGGTLFLDEILNLPASLQSKLLRALECGEVVPLGHSQPIRVDVRVVCAAQGSLRGAVATGHFRADLLGRLDGLTAQLPPLRERREEILPLFERLTANVAPERSLAIEPRFVEALLTYAWPLNVRELARLAQRLVTMHTGDSVYRKSMLPPHMTDNLTVQPAAGTMRGRSPADAPAEFEKLLAALRENDGNISKAAIAAGITRARAYRMIEAHPDVDLTPLRKSGAKP